MVIPSRYWTIWRFEAIEGGQIRTQGRKCDRAQAFFQEQFPQFATLKQLSNSQEREIQRGLFSTFRTEVSSPEELNHRAIAGLCLRCYVSYDILRTCHQLAGQYSCGELSSEILLNDLLPFTLVDTGETLIVPEASGKKYRTINPDHFFPYNTINREAFARLALKILGSYQPCEGSKNLRNWTHLLVRQSEEVQKVLLEYSIHISTPWSLLKRATPKQLEDFSDSDRRFVQAFQAVYRRDILNKPRPGSPCAEPSEAQLEKILGLLKAQKIAPESTRSLFEELKKNADRLRQNEIWKKRKHPGSGQMVTLDYVDSGLGDLIDDLIDPNSIVDSDRQEQQELLQFLYAQLASALKSGIHRGIEDRTIALSQSKSYAPFASEFAHNLCLTYVQNLSQRQIAEKLGISNQSRVSRIFSPKTLLVQIRFRTIEQLIGSVLEKARELGLTRIPPDKHYLSHLVCQLEDFVDAEIFNEATSEANAGINRSLNSIYARELRLYLSGQSPSETELDPPFIKAGGI